jgi:hypothetical protein
LRPDDSAKPVARPPDAADEQARSIETETNEVEQ